MPKRRASIRLKGKTLHANRMAMGEDCFVYVFVANRPHRYKSGTDGKSRIVYIGTTRKGLRRLVDSVFDRSTKIFGWGTHSFDAYILTCKRRNRVRMWLKLERALLLAFRERYGRVPKANADVKKMTGADAFKYFSRARIDALIENLGKRKVSRAA
jgi:hypothetical protein